MGVTKLWEILRPAAESRSILNLSTLHGFRTNNRYLRTFVLGDDISIRVNAVTAALKTAGIFHPGIPGQKLVLEKIFYQFCNLSLAPVTLIFVFDGPGRPQIKRGTRVILRDLWLIEQLKKMISYFGFHYYDAPGEAEAELAQLNANNSIDGIITEDSDAFLFGARLVIRTLGPSVQHHSVVYHMDSIENTGSVRLDRGGLLLCVLLLGGDYDAGVHGVGPAIAHNLALLFGQDLLHISEQFTGVQRDYLLSNWRTTVRDELRTNSRGKLGRCLPNVADKILDTFPNPQVIGLYINPLTSASLSYRGKLPDINSWKPRLPNIPSLLAFCSSTFGHMPTWTSECLPKKFRANLWPAVTFRLISSPIVVYFAKDDRFAIPFTDIQTTLIKMTKVKKVNADFADSSALSMHRVRASTQTFVSMAGLGTLANISGTDIELVSIPEVILAVAMRDTSLPTTSLVLSPASYRRRSNNVNSEGEDSDIDIELEFVVASQSVHHQVDENTNAGAGGDGCDVEVLDSDEEALCQIHRELAAQGCIDMTDSE